MWGRERMREGEKERGGERSRVTEWGEIKVE